MPRLPEKPYMEISIHALREEGDLTATVKLLDRWEISIHALREEGDLVGRLVYKADKRFLSTPSARRATGKLADEVVIVREFLSTPSARRATSPRGVSSGCGKFLSTPSARRATTAEVLRDEAKEFLSTPSARRATAKTETKSLFSNKLYNILHEFRRALIYNGSKNYPNHAK